MARGKVDLDALYKNYLPDEKESKNKGKSTVIDSKSTSESTSEKTSESTSEKTSKKKSKSTGVTLKEKKDGRISVRLKPSVKELFEQACEEEDIKVNTKINDMILAYLKKQKKL